MRRVFGLLALLPALLFAAGLTATLPTGPAYAVLPHEKLDDPELEARARVISKDIRCMVCQNQSIDDSNAELAQDLRVIVRERLVAGDSNEEVKQFLVDRYGDYVLMTPPMRLGTMLLWVGPFLLVALGGVLIFFWYRNRLSSAPLATAGAADIQGGADGLSAAERQRLRELLGEDGGGGPDGGGVRR